MEQEREKESEVDRVSNLVSERRDKYLKTRGNGRQYLREFNGW